MKVCNSCEQEKELSEFSRNGKYLRNKCKSCTRPQINSWYSENKESHLVATAEWANKNPESRKKTYKKYREENLEVCRTRCKSWQKRNPAKTTASASKYRASKLNATPTWLTQDHHKAIEEIYYLARECEMLTGDKYHVDHIVPLNGKNISGLHVPWNLQVLPADINVAKSNNY